jgi:hypothetical protein
MSISASVVHIGISLACHGRLGTCGTHVWHQLAVWCHIPSCASTWMYTGTLPPYPYPATGRPGTRGTHVLCHGCARLGTTLVVWSSLVNLCQHMDIHWYTWYTWYINTKHNCATLVYARPWDPVFACHAVGRLGAVGAVGAGKSPVISPYGATYPIQPHPPYQPIQPA